MTTLTQPNGSTVTYVYDHDGELTDTTDEDGRHDLFVQRRRRPDRRNLGGASPSERITYTYDADNELTGAADSYATLTFTYDSDGNCRPMPPPAPGPASRR